MSNIQDGMSFNPGDEEDFIRQLQAQLAEEKSEKTEERSPLALEEDSPKEEKKEQKSKKNGGSKEIKKKYENFKNKKPDCCFFEIRIASDSYFFRLVCFIFFYKEFDYYYSILPDFCLNYLVLRIYRLGCRFKFKNQRGGEHTI